MSLNFGEGINLESLNCPNNYNCNAKINLSSNVHPGLRDIIIFYKEKKIVATAKLLISETQEPDILSANPFSLEKEKEYTINLNTINFDIKTMQIDIGSGFEIKKFNCINKFNCLLDLKVLSDAKTGKRDIFIFYKNKRKMATAKLDIEKEKEIPTTKPTPPVIVVPEIKCEEKDFSNIEKAPIALLEPKIYSAEDYAIIKEGSLFKWNERYQGLAEWFEFRIIWNDKIIWTKKILPLTFKGFNTVVNYLPNFFKVDSDFLNEMANIDWRTRTLLPQGGMYLNTVYGVILQWQVAGYRNYSKSCIAGDIGSKVEVEVEISDKWNFALPNKPTGLDCKNAKTAPYIKIQNLDIGQGQEFGAVGTQNYPQDRIELSGSFDLSMAPYLVDNFFTVPPFSGQTYTTTLSNLIVDWGDGYINFPSVEFKTYGLSVDEAINKNILTIKPIVHKYKNVGKRKIRIFLLSEDDLQDINPAIIASAYDNYTSNPYLQLAYKPIMSSNEIDIAKKAYMIFCQEIEISPIEDQIANGVLHLESVNISSFNGQGFQAMISYVPPAFSNCQILQANADLKYYGKGNAYQKWSLIGEGFDLPIGGEWLWVGPSKQRENLTRDNFNKVTPDSFDYKPLSSPIVDLKDLEVKNYGIKIEVNVGLGEALALGQEEYLNAFFNKEFENETVQYASLVGNYYLGESFSSSSQNSYTNVGVQFGVLAPFEEAAGLPPFVNVESTPYIPEFPKEKPYYVKDNKYFKLVQSTEEVPCKFLFKTKSGESYEIDVYNKVQKGRNGKYNGSGNILIKLYKGKGFYFEKILKIKIQNWEVDEEGNVLKGEINEILGDQIETAGMKIKLEKLSAKANETDLELTLSVSPQDTIIRITGKTEGPEWKNINSILSSEGDWFWEGNYSQEISIGASGFRLKLNNIKIDLSSKEGEGIGPFCANDNSALWAGINFGNVIVIPYTFELNSTKNLPYEKSSNNWGVVSDGLCGKVEFPSFYSTYKKGSISFDKLEAETKSGNFKATYKNMDIEVPWLDIHMKGDAKYVPASGSELSHIDLTGLVSNKTSVTKSYKNVSFTAKNFKFGSLIGVGWATKADVFFNFKTKGVFFAKDVPVPEIYFDMDYRAYFDQGINEKEIAVNQSSKFGKSPVFVKSMKIKNNKTGKDIFSFSFNTSFSISTKLPTVDTPVSYSLIKESQTNFKSSGPEVSPFEVIAQFPPGNPNVKAKIKVEYDENLSSAFLKRYENYLAYNGDLKSLLFSAGSPEDYFKGEVDLTMIGAPIKAEFRLGYWGNEDYFLIRGTVDLGSGIPLSPPLPINLYKMRGGLGHNFPIDAFQSAQSIMSVQPKIDGSYLFMAGMRIGTIDNFTFVADGDFTIKINEGARMDFHSWILKNSHSGEGDFQGFLQYTGGAVDGSLWSNGPFYIIPNADIYFNVPKGSTTFHFSSPTDWFITAGKKDGGWDNLSNKLQGHIIFVNGYGYWMLGVPIGYHLGAYFGADLTVGDCNSACIYGGVSIGGEFGLSIQPFRVSGSTKAKASIGGCLKADLGIKTVGGCADFGVWLTCSLQTPDPTVVSVSFSLDPPIPCLDELSITIGIVPPSFSWDTEWCI